MDSEVSAASSKNVHTYHCICTNLIFASTQPLSALSQRAAGQDRAYILPLPALPRPTEGDEAGHTDDALTAASGPVSDFATTISTTSDNRPVITRRDDGFDKRYIHRCARCNVPIGYHLDWVQFPHLDAKEHTRPLSGANKSVLYVLPGGFLSTDEMAAGKDMQHLIDLAAS